MVYTCSSRQLLSLSVHWCFLLGFSPLLFTFIYPTRTTHTSYQVFGSPCPLHVAALKELTVTLELRQLPWYTPCSLSFWAIRSRLTLPTGSSSFTLTLLLSAPTLICPSSRGNTDRSNLSPYHSVSRVRRPSFFDSRSLEETGIRRAGIQSLDIDRYTSGVGGSLYLTDAQALTPSELRGFVTLVVLVLNSGCSQITPKLPT